MDYQIEHITNYNYDRLVRLAPHILRLRPRSDAIQTLHKFELIIAPQPQNIAENIDLDGNTVITIWFDDRETNRLQITTRSRVTTHRTNPFNFLLDADAARLPIDYLSSLDRQLYPYLKSHPIDSITEGLSQEIWLKANGNTLDFRTWE